MIEAALPVARAPSSWAAVTDPTRECSFASASSADEPAIGAAPAISMTSVRSAPIMVIVPLMVIVPSNTW